jgi:hypothetical protein
LIGLNKESATEAKIEWNSEELKNFIHPDYRIYCNSWEWKALTEALNGWLKDKENEDKFQLLRARIIFFYKECKKDTN